ncbi:MAG: polysaccharide deacetylase family protein [Candidatus Micrarchaeota archaeon]
MTKLVFTVDVERDSSHSIQGSPLRSTTLGQKKPGYTATEKGLTALIELLNEKNIKATLFFEAKTALKLSYDADVKALCAGHEIGFHGFNHEDFTGKKTGFPANQEEREKVFSTGTIVLEKLFGKKIFGFRAPYLLTDPELLQLAARFFKYDSSFEGKKIVFEEGITRIPVFKEKGMSGYLWKLMEKERNIQEYYELLNKGLKEEVMVIATHSWHSHRTRNEGVLKEERIKENLENIKLVLEKALEKGFEFTTMKELIKSSKLQ